MAAAATERNAFTPPGETLTEQTLGQDRVAGSSAATQGQGSRPRLTQQGMSAMKARHAAALALVVWYLMQPPLPHLSAHPTTPRSGPFSGWTIVKTFPTQEKCESHRRKPWDRCFASDDPRIKAKQDTSPFTLGHSSSD
jgi:hypothetical protein